MDNLQKDIDAYEKLKAKLEAENMGKWILIHDAELISIYETFELAAENAVKKFGAGPYLIKQIGAPPVTLPASVMFRPD